MSHDSEETLQKWGQIAGPTYPWLWMSLKYTGTEARGDYTSDMGLHVISLQKLYILQVESHKWYILKSKVEAP